MQAIDIRVGESTSSIMSAIDQIRVILSNHPDIDVVQLKKMIKTSTKGTRTSALHKDMCELVKKHDKATLMRLRKELKLAFSSVHQGEVISSTPKSAYCKFVQEQTGLMKGEEMWKDAPQALRMVEIGKRWKAHKQLNVADAASIELPTDDDTVIPSDYEGDSIDLPELPIVTPRRGKKRVDDGARPSSKPKRTRASR